MNSNPSGSDAPIATPSVFSRPAAMVGSAIGLVAVTAIATTLAIRPPAPADAAGRSGTATPLMAADMPTAKGATPLEAQANVPEKSAAPAPRAATAPKPVHTQRGTVKPAESSPRVANACATCGKVESVTAIKQKGEGTGLGVVGGAVVGGLVGSQIGGGSGKNVATVLGAVGGGVAGNEIEKRQRATTVYQVKVRMDDGSLRTVTQNTAPAVGEKVTVEGSTLRSRGAAS
jgi:outer membrane lipoprotein SlyB